MVGGRELLSVQRWGLAQARACARLLLAQPGRLPQLIAALFSDDPELRCRAADTSRRITERSRGLLAPHAEELIGLLAEIPREENRTRWHLALAAARTVHTAGQRHRLAPILIGFCRDASNEVRCAALEGLGELAAAEPSLRPATEELIAAALSHGSPALRCRARHALERIARAEKNLASAPRAELSRRK